MHRKFAGGRDVDELTNEEDTMVCVCNLYPKTVSV